PAASPSAFTTHGVRATASVAAVGTPAACITALANAFEPSICAAAAHAPKAAIPGLPGAAWSSVSDGLRAMLQASACSRAPEPTRSTRTRGVYFRRLPFPATWQDGTQ